MEIKNRPNRNEASHTGKTLLAQRLLEKYKNVVFAAILLFGACVFTACSKNDDEKALGIDTTKRVDKYKDMESLVESQPFSPVFTMADGDTVYAISLSGGDVQTDVNTIGVLASLVMEKAIADAILSSKIPDEEYLANI